tara:strand:+ start:185 stop:676 length:492 start_codon:yes stop_codon:yes gene_type:complete
MEKESRLVLINQYEILKKMDPDQADRYSQLQEILYSGYTSQYDKLFEAMSDEEASAEMQDETIDILEMFRALSIAMHKGWEPTDPKKAKFRGFDGNNDPHFSFASFLIDDQGRWKESSPNKNSHSSGTLHVYRAMLKVWKTCPQKYDLTEDQAEAIITAKPVF